MAEGITRIAIEGFKSIVNRQEIEIAPLTILAGANSSGKSSIMQPLLMLKQTLDAPYDPGPLLINGGHVRFTSTADFLSKVGSNKSAKLTIEITAKDLYYSIRFHKTQSEIEFEQRSTIQGQIRTFRPVMPEAEIRGELPNPHFEGKLTILSDRFLLNAGLVSGVPITSQWVEPFLRKMIHVPGLRGNPARTYQVAAVGNSFPGTFDTYTVSVIFAWQRENSPRYEDLIGDMHQVGLAQNLLAQRLNDAEMQLLVNRAEEAPLDMVSIADVGFGVSQTLPVLVALRAASEGQLVYLEEPEIHLHPRAQVKLADILAAAAKRRVRVVAETHSSLLLRAIQTLVAKGALSADLVRLHWFSRDAEGVTQVKSAAPDENGAFGDWPEDFGDVALQSEKEYLDAVENKLTR